jgi:UDP-arabinose 4-epimerase
LSMISDRGRVVLVTGGAGYIGSHTCKALARRGFVPVTLDNLVTGNRWAVKWGPFEQGDIRDRSCLDAVFSKYKPVATIHFAAFAYVGESVRDPGSYYNNNVCGSLSLLEAMRDHGVKLIVFSSSCATYGHPRQSLIDESHPQCPVNPYGMTKLVVERMLSDFDRAYQIRSVSLRYFNAAGADPEGEIGEAHDPETHLVPLILDVAAKRRDSITVFGSDYDTRDGSCVRDFVHVADLADAHVLALESLLDGKQSEASNLSNGEGFSVLEVVKEVESITGTRIPVIYGERRPGDPASLIGNSTLIQSKLGWRPQFPSLSAIIETVWLWKQNEPNLDKPRDIPNLGRGI